MTLTEEAIKFHLRTIIANQDKPALSYAVNYAKVGLGMTGHEFKTQCLYVLNNITHWRGDAAKECRADLKEFTKSTR